MNEYKLLKNIEKYRPDNGKLMIGLFDIYIDEKKNKIYKKNKNKKLVKEISDEKIFLKYKDFIENSNKKNSMKKYIIEGFDVERDGSYKCNFIEGIRLDKIPDNLNINQKRKSDQTVPATALLCCRTKSGDQVIVGDLKGTTRIFNLSKGPEIISLYRHVRVTDNVFY